MISIDESRKILTREEEEFTEKQVKEVRDFLYQLALIEFEDFKQTTDEKERGLIHSRLD